MINLPEQACFLPWIGAGRVWVGHCDGSQKTWAIDPASDTIVGTVSAFAIQAAFIGHAMWLESNNFTRVLRFDSRTLRRTGAINIEGLPVSGGGYLWVIGQDVPGGTDHQAIYQIDPATDRIIRRIHTPNIGIYGRTIYAYGALWEIGQGTGRLLRVNISTRAITVFHEPGGSTLTDGYEIFPLAARGSIWARTSDSRILRISPVTGRATAAYPGDANSAGMLAYTANTLWVASVQAASIWREPIRPDS